MVIAGAGGHALEIFDVLLSLGYSVDKICFYDDYTVASELNHCKVIKNLGELNCQLNIDSEFCLGVGRPSLRKKMYHLMTKAGGKHYSVISPFAIVSEYSKNDGADVMPFSFVSSQTILGKGSLVNTRANIHHEVILGIFNEISPCATLLGKVEIGDFNSVGSAATILPKIRIKNNIKIGAGALVTKDLEDNLIVRGVPAK